MSACRVSPPKADTCVLHEVSRRGGAAFRKSPELCVCHLCRVRKFAAYPLLHFIRGFKAVSVQTKDAEFVGHRGLDLHNVACVFNFDAPTSVKSYVHRYAVIGLHIYTCKYVPYMRIYLNTYTHVAFPRMNREHLR